MVDIHDTFYDNVVNIYTTEIVEKFGSDYKQEILLYEDVQSYYYIATRGNVVNWQTSIGNRQQDFDRIDLIIPAKEYDPQKPIKQGYMVEIEDKTRYIIDQLDYYKLPNGELDCVYIRLSQKGK